jgi:hypothetical protein
MAPPSNPEIRPAALVVAHPGHELRVFGWCERARPHTFVLTIGSRSGEVGRIASSRAIMRRTGAVAGSPFGRHRDRDIYAAILALDPTPFLRWTADLADALVALAPGLVVVDGWQMYNVSHDLTHVMARVAVSRAAARLGRKIDVAEFEVVPRALAGARPWGGEAFRVGLDDDALARKHAEAESYDELREDYHRLITLEGREAQRLEVFRWVVDFDRLMPASGMVPPYERYGEERVAAGIYGHVIRWNDHLRLIVEAIRDAAPVAMTCAS